LPYIRRRVSCEILCYLSFIRLFGAAILRDCWKTLVFGLIVLIDCFMYLYVHHIYNTRCCFNVCLIPNYSFSLLIILLCYLSHYWLSVYMYTLSWWHGCFCGFTRFSRHSLNFGSMYLFSVSVVGTSRKYLFIFAPTYVRSAY